jgi:hypothetical protein
MKDVLARLIWELHGKEILELVRTELPLVFLSHGQAIPGSALKRAANRETLIGCVIARGVLQRLDAPLADARTFSKQLKAGQEPGRSTKPW